MHEREIDRRTILKAAGGVAAAGVAAATGVTALGRRADAAPATFTHPGHAAQRAANSTGPRYGLPRATTRGCPAGTG